MPVSARIVCDSVYKPAPDYKKVRLTTFEITFNRFILAEVNTHKVLSKNSASSRAIPVAKQIRRIKDDIAMPVVWPAEQKGMQGGDEIVDVQAAMDQWEAAGSYATDLAEWLVAAGLHKSVVNRVLEPFMWHTAVITGTAWENFFLQRAHKDAQPEFQAVATRMLDLYREHEPTELQIGEWHLPYINDDDRAEIFGNSDELTDWQTLAKISAGRCARTSYLTQNGVRDLDEDLTLFGRLVDRDSDEDPRHWSPLEHPATPWPENRQSGSLHFKGLDGNYASAPLDHLPKTGNLLAYRSLRTEFETMMGQVTFR